MVLLAIKLIKEISNKIIIEDIIMSDESKKLCRKKYRLKQKERLKRLKREQIIKDGGIIWGEI